MNTQQNRYRDGNNGMTTYSDDQKQPSRLRNSFKETSSIFSLFKSINPIRNFAEFQRKFLELNESLKALFFLLIISNQQQQQQQPQQPIKVGSNDDHEFVKSINDAIVDMVLNIGESIDYLAKNGSSNDLAQFYYEYSQLVSNFAEKSPFKFLEQSTANFNRLINYLLNMAFNLLNQSSTNVKTKIGGEKKDHSKLTYEICRSLGSLIYQNGSKLNDSNLNRLLSSPSKVENSSYLPTLRIEIEAAFEAELKSSLFSEDLFDVINKLDLISTQISYNLTIPTITSQIQSDNTQLNTAQLPSTYEYFYVDDRYKIKVCSMLIRIIRFHNLRSSFVDSAAAVANNRKLDDDFKINKSKILTKALQGLENLFFSIKNNSMPAQQLNWVQSSENEVQIGDILAIVKEFSFYGIQNTKVQEKKSTENDLSLNEVQKLETSDIDEFLNPSVKITESINEQESGGVNNYGGNQSNTDEEDNRDGVSKKSTTNKNKSSTNKNNDQSKGGYRGKKFTKFRNNQHSNVQVDLNKIGSSINNSMICLKETQVPLIQYKNVNHQAENVALPRKMTDSDAASTTDSSSTNFFFIEKCNAKVRIASIGCLLTAFQTLEKRTIISYWSSFLSNRQSSLITIIKQDHSPKVRLIAATALAVYLECVRAFFSIAASEHTPIMHQANHQHGSFLPISSTIAVLIRQLHEDLVKMACYTEMFALNQVQLFKALISLIKATPYQKGMKPGLLYKLIGSLSHFMNRCTQKQLTRDRANLMIECLACLELILSNNYQLVEVHLALLCPTMQTNNLFTRKSSSASGADDIDSDLSAKLEKLNTAGASLKLPNMNQSRVTYFYENMGSLSMGNSNAVSGQATPSHCAQLIDEANSNKSWLVSFCIRYATISSVAQYSFSLNCFDLLSIVCKKYFDLLSRDLFFEELSNLILNNIDYPRNASANNPEYQQIEQMRLKTLKLLEDFARSLATDELRTLSKIDLNDCCKFWSSLLASKLISEHLCDEQRYLLSSTACDCLASMGGSVFELLPFQKRIYCLTNLLHLTKSQTSNSIRAASVRALGVYVTYTSLKEDQNFLNDLSVCLLAALSNETNNLVRQKTAWSMSNLSEVLIENGDKLGKIFTDEFRLTVWLRLLDTVTHTCRSESDKMKSYLVRALGNLINYASLVSLEQYESEFGNVEIVERSLGKAIDALCACRNVKMLKVKWNLSYSIGVAMRRFGQWQMAVKNPNWLVAFTDTLWELFAQSSNFKVRINACNALMTVNLNDKSLKVTGPPTTGEQVSIYLKLWSGLIDAFTQLKNDNIDATNELQHKTTLEHQLCKMFTYLCKYLRLEDLEYLMKKCLNELKINSFSNNKLAENEAKRTIIGLDEFKTYILSYVWKIHDQIESNKQEVQFYNDALIQLNLLNSSKVSSVDEDCINLLNNLLQKRPSRHDESESSETEAQNQQTSDAIDDKNLRKKFPFKQTYD